MLVSLQEVDWLKLLSNSPELWVKGLKQGKGVYRAEKAAERKGQYEEAKTLDKQEKAVLVEMDRFITTQVAAGHTLADSLKQLEYLLFVAWTEWQPPMRE